MVLDSHVLVCRSLPKTAYSTDYNHVLEFSMVIYSTLINIFHAIFLSAGGTFV